MLLQALAEYADSRLQHLLDDPAFERKRVPVLLEISSDGRFLGFVPHEETITRGKKAITQARERLVPKSPVNRNSGIHPLLAYDDAKHLFGCGEWTRSGQESDHLEKHHAFVALLERANQETGDASLNACVEFYGRPDEVERARMAFDPKVTGGIALSVAPRGPVIDGELARSFWRTQFEAKSLIRNDKGGTGMCLVSGKMGPIAPTHDQIKGASALGGQASGVAMMSFDKEAFRSYGWDKNANSPVSVERARAYVLALNDLLGRFNTNRVDHNGVGYLYWTRKPAVDDPMSILERADPADVERVLKLKSAGLAVADANEFYLLGVSGNGARLVVRTWTHDSLERVLHNVGHWFSDRQLVDCFTGEVAKPAPLWQVLKTLARDEPPPGHEMQFIRRAISGTPTGTSILAAALSRLRIAEGRARLEPVRAGVIRMALNDEAVRRGEDTVGDRLDPGLDNEAYLCGRLLAVYDSLQWAASGEAVGVTVADRYFSLACAYPSVAFPKVVDLGQKHLRKLRRDKPGAAVSIEREIHSILGRLGGDDPRFPGRLSLVDQGRFAIGFHHQRADNFAKARERRQATEEETHDRD